MARQNTPLFSFFEAEKRRIAAMFSGNTTLPKELAESPINIFYNNEKRTMKYTAASRGDVVTVFMHPETKGEKIYYREPDAPRDSKAGTLLCEVTGSGAEAKMIKEELNKLDAFGQAFVSAIAMGYQFNRNPHLDKYYKQEQVSEKGKQEIEM